MTGFWVSGILLIFYLLHVIEKFHVIPWVMIEMGYCGTWAFFYFTCALGMYLGFFLGKCTHSTLLGV